MYETTTSRLKKVTDPKLQDTNYTYLADDKLQQTTYTNAVISTPSVSFTYDANYVRVATMADGTGTTTYGYHTVTTPAALGATQLASVDGPLTNDTITYEYDELGRVTTRAIDGSANTVTWAFDALGRTTSEVNLLGTFTYAYDGPTGRVATVTYPNNQTSTYGYFGNSTDRRLQTIHHKYPNGTTLSKFDYTYDVGGNILTWRQQADNDAVLWSYGYDPADQLASAINASTDPTPAVLKRYAYAYDRAGNRTVEQIDDVPMGATYDNMNRLVSQQPSGALRLEGTVSKPATVTVGGKPFDVSGANRFTGSIPIVSGTTPFTVTAKDASGNTASQAFEVDSAGAAKTFTFDANGNMTSDGIRTFRWDAANRLIEIDHGAVILSTFAYRGDGMQATKVASGVTTQHVLDASTVVEDRGTPDGIARYFFGFGIDHLVAATSGTATRYYVSDHLLSTRHVTDATGAETNVTSYDAWGKSSGNAAGRFTGRDWDNDVGAYYYRARFYEPSLALFLSEDPLFKGSPSASKAYAYTDNSPVGHIDPSGLRTAVACGTRFISAVGGGNHVPVIGGILDTLFGNNLVAFCAKCDKDQIPYGQTLNPAPPMMGGTFEATLLPPGSTPPGRDSLAKQCNCTAASELLAIANVRTRSAFTPTGLSTVASKYKLDYECKDCKKK